MHSFISFNLFTFYGTYVVVHLFRVANLIQDICEINECQLQTNSQWEKFQSECGLMSEYLISLYEVTGI